MQKEVIDKANEIIALIEGNRKAIEELQNYSESGKILYTNSREFMHPLQQYKSPLAIHFEAWEVRLMIHNKQQRIKALEKQLEKL